MKEHRSKRGRPLWLDADSAGLLDRYTTHRLGSRPRPMPSSVRQECATLRSLLLASGTLGGPQTLRALVTQPDVIARVLRGEPPRSRGSLLAMRCVLFRFLDVVLDAEDADAVREQISKGLIHRPLVRASSQYLPRTVGGLTRIGARRPVLALGDIERLIAAAGRAFPNEGFTVRNRALIAVVAFSGLTLPEVTGIERERLELLDVAEHAPWCAFVHGVWRGRRAFSIPIHARAWPSLEAMLDEAAGRGVRVTGALFRSSATGRRALSYTHAARIVRATLQSEGLPGGDSMTFRRAYVAFLKQDGLSDFVVRDAIGVRLMATVDQLLQASRSRRAQAVAAEHHVLKAPVLRHGDGFQELLPLEEASPELGLSPRVLGVDPAFRRSGWALLAGRATPPNVALCGVIGAQGLTIDEGLSKIDRDFRGVLERCQPEIAWFERPGRWVHSRSSSRWSIELLAMARGMMLKTCAAAGVPVEQVDVGRVRQFLVGRHNASKAEVVHHLRSLGICLPVSGMGTANPDVADAIAVALYGFAMLARPR